VFRKTCLSFILATALFLFIAGHVGATEEKPVWPKGSESGGRWFLLTESAEMYGFIDTLTAKKSGGLSNFGLLR